MCEEVSGTASRSNRSADSFQVISLRTGGPRRSAVEWFAESQAAATGSSDLCQVVFLRTGVGRRSATRDSDWP